MQATPSAQLLNITHPNRKKKIATRAVLEGEVRRAIEELEEDISHGQRKSTDVDLVANIDRLLLAARKVGVEPENLVQLVDLACCGKLSGRLAYILLQCLIPRTTVPGPAVVKAVSWLCVGNLQPRLQVTLIKWITAVFYELDSQEELHAVYEIIFFYLEDGRMCQPVAQLLYHLTKKEDVRQHRVKKLMHLQTKMGSATQLVALLQLYKLFQPNLVLLGNQGRQQISMFSADSTWTPWITQLQSISSLSGRNLLVNSSQNSVPHQKRVRQGLFQSTSKRSASQRSLITIAEDAESVPMEQIRSFQELLHYIDRVQLPAQMSTTLRNRDFHVMLVCQPDSDMKVRLDLWLQHTLQEAFIQSPGRYSDEYRRQLLSSLVQFQDYIQRGLPSSSRFLVKFLHIWNGQDYQSLVLDLIPHFCVIQFKELEDFILRPLRKLFVSSSFKVKIFILKQLIELERNLIQNGCYGEESFDAISFSIESFRNPATLESLDAIVGLANCIGTLLHLGLEAEDNVLLMHIALQFYQLITDLPVKFGIPALPLIPLAIAHKALLAIDAMTLSRLCSLVCRYKTAIIALKSSPDVLRNEYTKSSLAQIETFNSLLLNISNSLWRNKAFVSVNPSTVTFGIPTRVLKSIQANHKQESFSIYKHIALLGYALTFQKITMQEMEMVNPRQLFLNKPEARDVYLDYLKRQRLPGISDFVNEFIGRKTPSLSAKHNKSQA